MSKPPILTDADHNLMRSFIGCLGGFAFAISVFGSSPLALEFAAMFFCISTYYDYVRCAKKRRIERAEEIK